MLILELRGVRRSTSSSFVAATTAASLAAQAVAKTALSEGNGGDFGGGSAAIEIPGQYVPNRIKLSRLETMPGASRQADQVRINVR